MKVFVTLVNNRELYMDYFDHISLNLHHITEIMNEIIHEQKRYGCGYDAWICELLNPPTGLVNVLNTKYPEITLSIMNVNILGELRVI